MTEASLAPTIADYGMIGDGRSAVLVSRAGSIDWGCLPIFDSDACFCRLLDQERGGYWRFGPPRAESGRRSYIGDTAVLVRLHGGETGWLRCTDFMPIPAVGGMRIIRLAECVSGRAMLTFRCSPTSGFGARRAEIVARAPRSVQYRGESGPYSVGASFDLHVDGQESYANVELEPGQRAICGLAEEPHAECPAHVAQQALAQTLAFWKDWVGGIRYDGHFGSQVRRSAVTLKMLIYSPSGAVVAAPTTSLPERLGGDLNWDYRFAWLRDSALTVKVFQDLGHHAESQAFFSWLCELGGGGPLQPVYTVGGRTDLTERTIDHLAGYAGSRPVRVGNAAAGQAQLDTAGHLLDAVHHCFTTMPRPIDPGLWRVLRESLDRVCERWNQPDSSIWETRRERRQFLHSKVLAWMALDRGVALAEHFGLPGDRQKWSDERARVRALVFERGYNQTTGAFTGVLGTDELDASTLMISTTGLLPADDSRMRSTVERTVAALGSQGLLWRNRRLANEEGEGAFVICPCWLAEYLAARGQLKAAEEVLDRVAGCGNDLGLLSEEVDPASGGLLGNFPQGFSHLGLIQAALKIDSEGRRVLLGFPGKPGDEAGLHGTYLDERASHQRYSG